MSQGQVREAGTTIATPVSIAHGGLNLTSTVVSAGLLTDGGGIPGWVAYTGSGKYTLNTSPTISNPIISTKIIDSSTNTEIFLSASPLAVDNVNIINAITDKSPTINVVGTDSIIPLTLAGQNSGGINIVGVQDGSNASYGEYGEFLSKSLLFASSVAITVSGAPGTKTIVSILLPAGDWDVWGNLYFANTIGSTNMKCGISTTNNTLPDNSLCSQLVHSGNTSAAGLIVPEQRANITVDTTYYLVGFALFAAGQSNCSGGIYARRRR